MRGPPICLRELTAEEASAVERGMPGTTRKDHQAARLIAIRLRYCINTHLEDQGIATPAQIGAATGLPAASLPPKTLYANRSLTAPGFVPRAYVR
jgi:hypothetical protein